MQQPVNWSQLQENHGAGHLPAERLGTVLNRIVAAPAFQQASRLAGLPTALAELLRPSLCQQVWIGGVRGGRLVLYTSEAALAYELRLNYDVVLSAVRRHCPQAGVHDLVVKVGEGRPMVH